MPPARGRDNKAVGDWAPFIAILAVLTSIAALAMNIINSGASKIDELRKEHLSLREHDEYRHGVNNQFDAVLKALETKAPTERVREYKDDWLRELELLRQQVIRIDNTKPTAGELKGTADGLKEQLLALERRIEETARAAAMQRMSTAATLAHENEK